MSQSLLNLDYRRVSLRFTHLLIPDKKQRQFCMLWTAAESFLWAESLVFYAPVPSHPLEESRSETRLKKKKRVLVESYDNWVEFNRNYPLQLHIYLYVWNMYSMMKLLVCTFFLLYPFSYTYLLPLRTYLLFLLPFSLIVPCKYSKRITHKIFICHEINTRFTSSTLYFVHVPVLSNFYIQGKCQI